jgi:hypothetical protein
MTHSKHNPQRTIEQIIEDEATNTPITKTYDERYAEHEANKANNPMTRAKWDELRLRNKKAVNELRREKFALNVAQVKRIKVDMAIHLIRNTLHQIGLTKDVRYNTLINHPAAAYLYSAHRDQLFEVFPIPLEKHNRDKHREQPALAQVIKAVLPDFALAFETHPALDEIWSLAACELAMNPLPLLSPLPDRPTKACRGHQASNTVQACPSNNELPNKVLHKKSRFARWLVMLGWS